MNTDHTGMRSALWLPIFDGLADPAAYAKAGATWWMAEFPPEVISLDEVRGLLRDGPAAA